MQQKFLEEIVIVIKWFVLLASSIMFGMQTAGCKQIKILPVPDGV